MNLSFVLPGLQLNIYLKLRKCCNLGRKIRRPFQRKRLTTMFVSVYPKVKCVHFLPRFLALSLHISGLSARIRDGRRNERTRRINKKSIIVGRRTGLARQSGRKLDSPLFMGTRHRRTISRISLNRTTVRSIISAEA